MDRTKLPMSRLSHAGSAWTGKHAMYQLPQQKLRRRGVFFKLHPRFVPVCSPPTAAPMCPKFFATCSIWFFLSKAPDPFFYANPWVAIARDNALGVRNF